MKSFASRPFAAIAVAAAAALVVAGCTAEKKDGADSASPGNVAPPAPKIAPGVTEDSIKLGIVYPDLSAVKQFMNIDHGDYKATYTALVDKINANGGINGRKIVPVFGAINVASPAAAQETCVKLTQDEKVFAVIGTFNANEPLCYVQNNKTAVVGGPLTAKNYAQAQAPWFSFTRGGDELTESLNLFTAGNALAGKKVAVVGVVNEQALVNDIVLPTLQKLGVTPVATGILDASFRDAAAVSQQTGVFIEKFRSAGADTVLVVGGMGQQFPTQLEKTDYRPRLLFTNTSVILTYTNDTAKHDFTTLKDASAVNPNVPWDEPSLRECAGTVETAIPALRDRLIVDPSLVPAGEPSPGTSLTAACQNLALFKAIADKAGKDLNYESFQNAGFGLGSFQIPGYPDKGEFTKANPHGAIPSRLFVYDPLTQEFVLSAT